LFVTLSQLNRASERQIDEGKLKKLINAQKLPCLLFNRSQKNSITIRKVFKNQMELSVTKEERENKILQGGAEEDIINQSILIIYHHIIFTQSNELKK
jgi:hypothetical protein